MQQTRYPALWLILTGFALAGCGHGTRSTAPAVGGASVVADSPANAVRVLESAMNTRDVDAIAGLLTGDFQFVTASTDSVGSTAPSVPWTRDTFLATLQGLLVGTADRPPAEQVSLTFDQNLVPFPDTRPGRNPKWHEQVRTSVNFKVRVDSGSTIEVTGGALFFLTRGDSAQIPQDLVVRGLRSDSTRWWMDHFEDETLSGAGLSSPRSTNPSKNMTLGQVLSLWLPTTRP